MKFKACLSQLQKPTAAQRVNGETPINPNHSALADKSVNNGKVERTISRISGIHR